MPSNEPTKPGKLLRCPHEGCGKVFRSSPGYRYHLRSHDTDPRPHVCQVCQKKFKSANGLKYHLRKAHHIEPVASKQNANNSNNNNNANSPKDNRESLSSEEDHMFNLNDSFTSRGYVNGGGGGSYSSDRTSSIPPSPLVKSPHGLNSPLLKGGILSPLIKSPLDLTPYLSTSSNGSGAQSPYVGQDRYGQFFDRRNDYMRNSDFVRKFGPDEFDPRSPSLSEYTQQCAQANREFRATCQRLSTSDPRLPSVDFASQRSCEFYSRQRSGVFPSPSYPDFNNHHKKNNEEPQYTSLNDVKGSSLTGGSGRLFSPYKDLPMPNEGKEYPSGLLNQNMPCVASSCSMNSNSCSYPDSRMDGGFSNMLNLPSVAKSQCNLQNTEQIVPDISSPGCNLSPPRTTYDRNNNNAKRGASESSIETEMSDSVFQNENSNFSPLPQPAMNALSPVLPSPDIIKKIRTDSESSKEAFPGVIIYYHTQWSRWK